MATKKQTKPKQGILLSEKTCTLGKSLKGHNVHSRPGDGEEEGDAGEPIAAKELAFKGIVLTQKQADFFLGEDWYRRNFEMGSKPHKYLNKVRRLSVPETFIGCEARLVFGVQAKELELTETVKFKNLRVVVDDATDTVLLHMTLVAPFPRKLESLDIENFYDKTVIATLKLGELEEEQTERQAELEMDHSEEGNGEEDGEVAAPGRRRARNGERPPAH